MGIGTAAWGEKLLGYGKAYSAEDIFQTYKACLDAGLNFFDTAEHYGRGESEKLLGECRHRDERPIIISTKYAPPGAFSPSFERSSPDTVLKALDASLARLNVRQIDLYNLHFPPPKKKLKAYLDKFAEAFYEGKIRAVGVCNFNEPLIREAHAYLAYHNIPLASNQVAYNLLKRYVETNGVLKACRELNISLIATGPLEEGVLTGKFRSGAASLSAFKRIVSQFGRIDWFGEQKGMTTFWHQLFSTPRMLQQKKLEPLFIVLEEIAETRLKTIGQVVLNWLMTKDECIIPIPGAKNKKQAIENIGALAWALTAEERDRIEQAEMASR